VEWLWSWGLILLALFALLAVLTVLWRPLRNLAREAEARHAHKLFQQQREHLEARFLHAAAASGKPRGLRWLACDWESPILLVRERRSGELHALVGVTIQFEAVAGSDMEGLPAVGNLRNASGVFFFHRGQWHTNGRAVFNMNPSEAVEHFKQQYERVELN
jgi:hypothetical protein